MNLYIDYLTNEDRETQFYVKFLSEFDNTIEYIQTNSREEFLEALHNKDLVSYKYLAIKTHGVTNSDHLCKDDQMHNAISYEELINILNTIQCQNMRLILIGICNSVKIEQYLSRLDNLKFSEVLVSLGETENIYASTKAMEIGFDIYMDTQIPETCAKFTNIFNSSNWLKEVNM